jgi:hypothetical protein
MTLWVHYPGLEHALAWDLADAARPMLDAKSRSSVFVMLGVGDTREVIERILEVFATRGRNPPDDLVARTAAWLDRFVGGDDERRLRQLLDRALYPT